MHKLLLLITLLSGFVFPVQAHDPGLSRASVELYETGLEIHMAFARKDIEVLLPMDADHDGTVTTGEFSAVRAELQRIIMAGIDVRDAKGKYQLKSVHIEPASGDSVDVDVYYSNINASVIQLHIPLIAQLARGHRQYLTVKDANGTLLAQYMLDANSPPVLLGGTGPDGFRIFREYLVQGVWHIWIGFDHILFVLTLLLPAVLVYEKSRWKPRDKLRPAIKDALAAS